MAKQIIILGKQTNGSQDNFNLAFWFPITSGALTKTNGSSWAGASAAENVAIQNGSVLEEVTSVSFPVGLAAVNPTAVKAYLQQQWTNRNAQLTGVGPAQYAGIFDDSVSGWSA